MKTLQTNKVGRPTKITEEVVKKLQSILQLGVNDTVACQYAKISRETFYNRLEVDEVFRDVIESAKQLVTIAAGQVVSQSIIKDKDVASAKWWLERKAPDEFGIKDKPQVQVNILNNVIKNDQKEYGF